MRVRKTVDEYHVLINYAHGDGYEHEVTEPTYKEAKLRVKEYRDNCTSIAGIKIVKKRVKKEDLT